MSYYISSLSIFLFVSLSSLFYAQFVLVSLNTVPVNLDPDPKLICFSCIKNVIILENLVKCLCAHQNITALLKQISLFDTALLKEFQFNMKESAK